MTVSSKRKTKAKSLSKTKSSSKSKSRKNVSKTRKMHGGVKTHYAPMQPPKFNLMQRSRSGINPSSSSNSNLNYTVPDLRLKSVSNPLPIPKSKSNPNLNPNWFHKIGASLGVSSSKNVIQRHQDEKEKEFKNLIASTVSNMDQGDLFTKNKQLAIYRKRLSNEISRNPLYINGKPLNKKMLKKEKMLKHINHMHDLVFQRAIEDPGYVKAVNEIEKQRIILDTDRPANYLKMITEKNKELKRLYNLANPNNNNWYNL
jgi:hypothetical protein